MAKKIRAKEKAKIKIEKTTKKENITPPEAVAIKEKSEFNLVSIIIKAFVIFMIALVASFSFTAFKKISWPSKKVVMTPTIVISTPVIVVKKPVVVKRKKSLLPAKYVHLLKPAEKAEEIQKIHLEEAKVLFDSHLALFVDARAFTEYQYEHITGAISIPSGTSIEKIKENDEKLKGKILVSYCHGAGCHMSDKTAEALFAAGYKKVLIFFGGWNEWTVAQYPIEGYTPPDAYKYLYEDMTSVNSIREIKLEEAKFLFDNMNAIFIDVDTVEKFNEAHIDRTTSLPLDTFDNMLPRYDGYLKGKPVVIYSHDNSDKAKSALVKIYNAGHKKLMIFPDAISQWEKAGYPLIKAVK